MEVLLFAAAVFAALVTVVASARHPRHPRHAAAPVAGIVVAVAILCLFGAAAWHARISADDESRAKLVNVVPNLQRDGGFKSSSTCQSCHPRQFASWHDSFHRTMTQLPSRQSVIGDFENVRLQTRGQPYYLSRHGDEFWCNMVDPVWEQQELGAGRDPARNANPPRVDRRIVMTTGSHHMQFYWYESRFNRTVFPLPFGFLVEGQTWVPTEHTFLQPPGQGPDFVIWNTACIKCHSVAGQPRHDYNTGLSDTAVAELGISCEACHGPAEEHIRANRDPQRRYRQHLSGEPDPTIVNPKRLPPRRASELCGQCHSITFPANDETWNHDGSPYRAGGELEKAAKLVRHPGNAKLEFVEELVKKMPDYLEESFWSDGMIRISGREYSSMIESGCFQHGDLSCLSCHSMHESKPDDQLAARMDGDEACLQCHENFRGPARISEHTHHAAGSEGSSCYNCHMPYTTYGLLKAIRSHQINSPSVAASVTTGRPNACNLCHVDQTLQWTSAHLAEWYGQAPVELSDEQREVSAALLWLLKGEAGQRALAAWHLGWAPAQQVAGRDWMAPYLAQLLVDPYAAVRFVARRSLRTLPGFADFQVDYIAPLHERQCARVDALAVWESKKPRSANPASPAGGRVLIDDHGDLMQARIEALLAQRDDRNVKLAE